MNPKKVAALAQGIYEERIRSEVEKKFDGNALVIDVDSGAYEVDLDEDAAFRRIQARHPKGIFYVMRIGSPASLFVGTSVG